MQQFTKLDLATNSIDLASVALVLIAMNFVFVALLVKQGTCL